MKRFIYFILLMFCVISINAQTLNSFNIGYSYSFKNYDLKSNHNLETSFHLKNIFFNCSVSSSEKVSENEYGSGGVSDNFKYTSLSCGYAFRIKDLNYYNSLFFTPIIGIMIEDNLYNDKYYGKDVANSKVKSYFGGMVSYKFKSPLLLSIKATNYNIGVQIGYSVEF